MQEKSFKKLFDFVFNLKCPKCLDYTAPAIKATDVQPERIRILLVCGSTSCGNNWFLELPLSSPRGFLDNSNKSKKSGFIHESQKVKPVRRLLEIIRLIEHEGKEALADYVGVSLQQIVDQIRFKKELWPFDSSDSYIKLLVSTMETGGILFSPRPGFYKTNTSV